jgi:hypothetical protein
LHIKTPTGSVSANKVQKQRTHTYIYTSVPEHSIKVIKLLAGIIPYKTLWEFNATKAGGKDPRTGLIAMFTDKTIPEVKHPLDAIILKLAPCRSCNEAVRALQQAEKAYRNS